jgi:hypothetical protein
MTLLAGEGSKKTNFTHNEAEAIPG